MNRFGGGRKEGRKKKEKEKEKRGGKRGRKRRNGIAAEPQPQGPSPVFLMPSASDIQSSEKEGEKKGKRGKEVGKTGWRRHSARPVDPCSDLQKSLSVAGSALWPGSTPSP